MAVTTSKFVSTAVDTLWHSSGYGAFIRQTLQTHCNARMQIQTGGNHPSAKFDRRGAHEIKSRLRTRLKINKLLPSPEALPVRIQVNKLRSDFNIQNNQLISFASATGLARINPEISTTFTRQKTNFLQ
jgi:hypothetical protein